MVGSVVQHLGDDERAFPHGGELVRSLLIYSEHVISLLECPTLDVSCMKTTKVLLINSRPCQSHLSLFLQEINSVLSRLLGLGF